MLMLYVTGYMPFLTHRGVSGNINKKHKGYADVPHT
jgi:hypothetical protein